MMANLPIFQDMAAALLTGAPKPAAAVEGEGVDFAALLAGVGAGQDSAPGQAVAAAKRPDFVTAMLAQRHGEQAENVPSEGNGGTAELTLGLQAAVLEDSVPEQRVAAGANVRSVGTEPLPDGAELPLTKAPAPDRPVKQSTPARFAHVTSMLPQMAKAMNATPGKADTPAAAEDEVERPVKADDQTKASPPPLMQGLALPLLQGLEPPAANAQPDTTVGKGADVPAQRAQIYARAGGADIDPSLDADAKPSGVSHAAAPSVHHRQALALELGVSSLGQGTSAKKAPAATPAGVAEAESLHNSRHPGEGRGLQSLGGARLMEIPAFAGMTDISAKSEKADDDVIMPSSAPFAAASPVLAMSLETSGTMDMAMPSAPAISAADTGAMLGEQVIDMGVEGQWIDRMAREIADISAGTGRATFTLNPENLGRLQVDILQRDDGADVRLIADTDEAAAALSQGRQQLQQDARLQAVRIHDVQVERAPVERGQPDSTGLSARGQAMGQEMAGQQGQSQPFHKKPLIEAVSSNVTGQEQDQAASERARSQHARYA
jgi:flagellar hook-length control protein FliK